MATEIRKATSMALPSHSPPKQAKRQPLANAPTRPDRRRLSVDFQFATSG
jgi:hypothetical protein